MAAPRLRTLRKALNLSPRDWWRVAVGQAELFRARRDVRTRPRGELVKSGDQVTRDTQVAEPERLTAARHAALGVTRAAAHGAFIPTCLVRSIAICRLLEREGIEGAQVRVGVARRRGKFVAHAWVEFAGEIIGDDDANATDMYTPLNDLQVPTDL